MRVTIAALFVLALVAGFATDARADSYVYVGSWYVDDGPYWAEQDNLGNYTTPIWSGVEAAAYLFGGSPGDYVTSTVSADPNDINFKAWMDGYGDAFTYGSSGNPAAQDLHVDSNNDGLYAIPGGNGSSYSAYVSDHGLHLQNFAFAKVAVPEPSSLALLGLGLVGFGLARRRRK